MQGFLLENLNAKIAFGVTAVAAAAATGERINVKENGRVTFFLIAGGSTGADVKVNLLQHNAATSGTSKVLPIMNKYFVKAGAATVFTQTEPTADASTIELTALDDAAGLVAIEVRAEDLDVNNGFAWMSCDVPIAGQAKNVVGLYIAGDCRTLPPYNVGV